MEVSVPQAGVLTETNILDVLEHFYQDDIGIIADHFESTYQKYGKKAFKRLLVTELLDVYQETWVQPLWVRQEMGDFLLPTLQPGEIRLPVTPSDREIWERSLAGNVKGYFAVATVKSPTPWEPGALIEACRRKLLYAHSLVLDSQLSEYFVFPRWANVGDTVVWVRLLASLAPLIRGNLIFVTPTVSAIGAAVARRGTIFSVGTGVSVAGQLSSLRPDLRMASVRTECMRFVLLEGQVSLEGSTEERATCLLEKIREYMPVNINPVSPLLRYENFLNTVSQPEHIFTKLGTLKLPGLSTISLSEMVAVREDDHFAEFRSSLRTALVAAEREGQRSEMAFYETMTAARAKLHRDVQKGSVSRAVIPGLLGWLVGAIVGGPMAGWPGWAAEAVVQSAYVSATNRRSTPDQALIAHMVAVERAGTS